MNRLLIHNNQKEGTIHPELHSQFIEFLGGCIYDGIWVGQNSAIPNIDGLRKDVVEALIALAPPVIRWPGGCFADTYHWRNGIGPADKRPVTYNENFATFELDTNQFGTHEFMRLCRLTGAKPWLNINLLSGTVAEMRDWVEYCNRREGTSLSRERAENGDPEPFDVAYWGIGNECWGGGGCMTARQYADLYRLYATAMPMCDARPFSDHGLKLTKIASGPDGNKPGERVQWTRDFFAALAEYRQPQVDAIDLHFYNWNIDNPEDTDTQFDDDGWYKVIGTCFELENVIKEQYQLIQEGLDHFPKAENTAFQLPKHCDLVVGEWGNWHGSAFRARPALFQQCTMRDALTTALSLDIFHRNCDKVRMACAAQTVNVLNSLILTDGAKTILTPNYDVFMMYKVHRGAQKLALEAEAMDEKLYTFASAGKDRIHVNVVNTDLYAGKSVDLIFTDHPQNISAVGAQLLACDDVRACNTAENPDRIRRTEGRLPEKTTAGFRCEIPPASVQVFSFQVE